MKIYIKVAGGWNFARFSATALRKILIYETYGKYEFHR
ncbi:Hypothetical protein Cp262_2248 [Corynebacterium pseudotuberculosis]|nr:Hypothetical protein Cp262_2248 [Corynebacterium pseudotuberculosis]